MKRYALWRAADAAVDEIYVYTVERWGVDQADKYILGLFARLDDIAERRIPWRPIPAEFEVDGYFTRYEQHYLFWRVLSDGRIGVFDILGVRMDVGARLRERDTGDEADA